MKQRNDTGYDQHVSVWANKEHPERHPFVVAAWEETDYPERIGSLTLLPENDAKPKSKDAAAAAVKEEGEPQ